MLEEVPRDMSTKYRSRLETGEMLMDQLSGVEFPSRINPDLAFSSHVGSRLLLCRNLDRCLERVVGERSVYCGFSSV